MESSKPVEFAEDEKSPGFRSSRESYRNEWLRYAWDWVRQHDPAGYLEMLGCRCLSQAANGQRWHFANQPSAVTPAGSGQEQTVRAIWAADAAGGSGK